MLHVVRISTNSDFAPVVEAGLELIGLAMASWHAVTGAVQFECYAGTQPEAEAEARRLRQHLGDWAAGETWDVTVAPLPDEDWQEAWKAFFRTTRVAPHVTVRPPWEPLPANPTRCVVTINPGLSFGTGTHFTTRSCLRLLDDLGSARPGGTLVDAGCGSGILAIAAVQLGYTRVHAFDNDPVAIGVAEENAAANGVAGQIRFAVAGVDTFTAPRAFDVVVANLYDELLCRHAAGLAALAAPGNAARLVLAGMLRGQFPAVRAAFAQAGFVPETVLEDDEWTSTSLRRV